MSRRFTVTSPTRTLTIHSPPLTAPTHSEPLNLPWVTLKIPLHHPSNKVTLAGHNHVDLIAECDLVWPLKVKDTWRVFEVMAVVKFYFIFGFSLHELLLCVSSDFFRD